MGSDCISSWSLLIFLLFSWMTTCLGKSCSPRVPFVNCCQFMYLVLFLWVLRAGYQNQNQNCYLWHVQMTIIHQDLWWGKLVPSPYKRSELSNRVFCSFSSRKESICKWIPISNSLGKEAALVNVSISKGGLKWQRVVISDMPNWWNKVIRRYTGCTLQTFVKHYDSTISPPFFQRFPL